MTKSNKGITLIALVITIIILLILAGITVTFMLGENGLLNKSNIAREEARGASVEEQSNLWKADVEMNKYDTQKVETLDEILARLQKEGLLTNEEVTKIKTEENVNREVTIGSKTISFKINEVSENTKKNPNTEIIGDGSFINGVNTPKLGDKMIPIVYDNTINTANENLPAYWRKANNEIEWYDYTTQKWANAVTEDGSIWVWIPRYEYKIVEGEILVNFIPTTVSSKNGGISQGYRIHPAFEDGSSSGKNNNFKNGEWDKELDGIWIAKFEASRADSKITDAGTSELIKIQADVKSWTNLTIGDSYTNSLNMLPKYNSHLMKNSEWGAVAYLTHSKYGRNKIELAVNDNTNVVTGGGNYKENTQQSSTGNPFRNL